MPQDAAVQALDLATSRVVTMRPDESLRQAAQLMQQHMVGCVVISNIDEHGHLPIGLLTDRDLSRLALAGGLDGSITAEAVMSRPLVLCPREASLAEIVDIMRGSGLRRLPVVDGHGCLAGIVTASDVVVGLTQLLQQITEVLVIEPSLKDRMVAIQCAREASEDASLGNPP